jgi:hypothetical protein
MEPKKLKFKKHLDAGFLGCKKFDSRENLPVVCTAELKKSV